VSVLAAIRPDDVNFPLLLHVLGAMLLLGTLFTVAVAVVAGWRRNDAADAVALQRFALRTLLIGVFPSFLLMRIAAQWVYEEQGWGDAEEEPGWLGVGYITGDIGGLLVLISLVLSGIGLWRLRRGGGGGLAKAVGVISVLLLVAYLVAVWAMTTKPD
jgi:hypothetical protein